MGLIFMIALTTSGCKRCDDPGDPECKNYDPCYGQTEVSAEFVMGNTFTNQWHPTLQDTFLISDTVLQNLPMVEFRGPDGYDSYEWRIGQDNRIFTDQDIALLFTDPEPLLKVQLIVKRNLDLVCFPGEDGRDTVVKYLTVIPFQDAAIIGSYRGVLASEPTDSFDIYIKQHPQFIDPGYFLFEINRGCIPEHFSMLGRLGHEVFIQSTSDQYFEGGCHGVVAWAFLDSTHRFINIDYKTRKPFHRDQFHGIKIY